MPLNAKGEKIMSAMKEQYGPERGKEVFYASANKGTIEGVHDSEPPVPERRKDLLGVVHDADAEPPVPERRKDLLGETSTAEGFPPAEVKSHDQTLPTSAGTSSSSTSSTTPMLDEKVKEVSSPPMNNLGGPPGGVSGPVVPWRGVQVGDSLRNQNIANRAFWAARRRR